jgi:hypothetical protein
MLQSTNSQPVYSENALIIFYVYQALLWHHFYPSETHLWSFWCTQNVHIWSLWKVIPWARLISFIKCNKNATINKSTHCTQIMHWFFFMCVTLCCDIIFVHPKHLYGHFDVYKVFIYDHYEKLDPERCKFLS